MTRNGELFGRIILIEVGILILGIICLVPTAFILSRSNTGPARTSTPTPPSQTDLRLQTIAAQVVQTQGAAMALGTPAPGIPVTGATPEVFQPYGDGNLRVTFINVIRGDAILIQSPEGRYALIDGGPEGGGALQYLQSHGINWLDVIIATYPNADHIGGLTEILGKIPVARVITNGEVNATQAYQAFLDAIAAAQGTTYYEVKRGDTITFQNVRLDVLNPARMNHDEINQNALVLRLVHGNISFLFMSDADAFVDQELLSSGQVIDSTILKVGNHAAEGSLDSAFLNAVSPEAAVYFSGAGSDLERPTSSVIHALNNAGAKVYGTDTGGTTIIFSDGSSYVVATQNEFIPSPTPIPTPLATATTAAVVPVTGPLTITVTSLTNPVRPGGDASMLIQTSPGATCSNIINHTSGSRIPADLGSKTANAQGEIRWDWKVGENATEGIWTIEVYCSLAGQALAGSLPFEVVK